MLASRLHWRLLIGTVLVLMAAAWLAPRFVRPPDIQENRILAAKPAWPKRAKDIAAFRKAADAYVADHFPPRPYLIGGLNRLRMIIGVSGSNRVIVGRQGWLFFDDETHLGAARGDPPMLGPEVRQWLLKLAGRTEMLHARGIPYLVVAAPVKETIYPQFGPAWFPGPSDARPTVRLSKLAGQTDAGDILYLHDAVAAATRAGQKTFSRHDTHWTGYGAYAGYAALMGRLHAMGLTEGPRPFSDFELVKGGQAHRPRDLALMLGVSSFVDIDFPHIDNPSGEQRARTTFLSDRQDWTAPQIVDTGQVGKPTLLLTRDSFSNEILPLLLSHFSRIILAHNQDGPWRPDLIDRFKPDIVVLEVVEHGLRVSMGDGPDPSPEAASRIDRVLATEAAATPGAAADLIPTLKAPDAKTAAIIAGARSSGNCNLEMARITPGENGQASFDASGWMSELGWRVTSPNGLIALRGPGGLLVSSIVMDKPRPDVAAFFKNPNGTDSGFVGTFFISKLPAGSYMPSVYRRAGGGWIGCQGKQAITAP